MSRLVKNHAKLGKIGSTDLLVLLEQTDFLAEEERGFWLANYHDLPAADQRELARILCEANQELGKETERYQNHVAEINAKCVTRLKKFATQHKDFETKQIPVPRPANPKAQNYLDDEELLEQLKNFGEI